MGTRPYYFGAGPAAIPEAVLKNIQEELLNYQDSGISILELSHRSNEFFEIINNAESLLRELLQIPMQYAVLFMHGGATSQYSMLPMNFIQKGQSADYVCTGLWSSKAYNEATKLAKANQIRALNDDGLLSVLPEDQWELSSDAVYVHYCNNETISGVAFLEIPNTDGVPLVCDMTSSLLTSPLDIEKFSIIYASTQKNLGVAGLTVLIADKEFIGQAENITPHLFDYAQCEKDSSLSNTPPIFAIYVLNKLLEWAKNEGGVARFKNIREKYAEKIYDLIDESAFYINNVSKNYRSKINIPFQFKNLKQENDFLQQAKQCQLIGLQGHRVVGGIRISLFNSMPAEGIEQLIEFMQKFEIENRQT